MKCCKKWKEANRVGWLDEDEYWVWYKRKEINFCPQCGSSLKEESKWCECEGMTEMTPRYVREYHCDKCGKQIAPFYDGSKPTPKLPEKIDSEKWAELDAKSDWVGYPDFSYVDNLIEKYNQLIDYLEAKK